MAWVDPRFGGKKPKPIKLNKFGEAPSQIKRPAALNVNTSRANVNLSRGSPPCGPSGISRPGPSRPMSARPGTARPGTARPPSAGGPSVCAPQVQARPPPLAPRPCPEGTTPQVGISWRQHQGGGLRPPTNIRQLRPPSQICPPSPARAPSPPRAPSPRAPSPRAPSPPRAPPSIQTSRLAAPRAYASTPLTSGLRSIPQPSTSGISRLRTPGTSGMSTSSVKPKCQKIVLLPGDINPQETTVITVEPPPPPKRRPKSNSVRFVKTKSIKPAWVGPCPDPEPEPEPARPQGTMLSISPPRTGAAPRRMPRFVQRRLGMEEQQSVPCPEDQRPASRQRVSPPPCPPDTSLYDQPCPPQSREVCPPDPCPPPPCPEECPPPPCPEECPPPPCPDECPPPPCPEECPPDPNEAWFNQMLYGTQQQQPCPAPTYQQGENLLDITPPQEMMGFELQGPQNEDLIMWEDPQDPWSPTPRAATPPPSSCIDFIGKQDPFSPPKLEEYYARRYPQLLDLPQNFEPHPVTLGYRLEAQARLPSPARIPTPCAPRERARSPIVVDRELLARSVPHNRRVSTVCRDDSAEDDLGLLPDDDFCSDDDLAQPLSEARARYNPMANVDIDQLRRTAREKLMQVKIQAELDDFICRPRSPPQRSREAQEAMEAAARVQQTYASLFEEPPPCPPPPRLEELEQALGEYDDLAACTLDDDIDFDAIDAEPCD